MNDAMNTRNHVFGMEFIYFDSPAKPSGYPFVPGHDFVIPPNFAGPIRVV